MPPRTHYVKNGDVYIAYQIIGDGPFDLVFIDGFVTHLECYWEEPRVTRFLQRLASFSRLIMFDKRGCGMSDRVAPDSLPPLEVRMDDLRAVMDAAGSSRAAIFALSEGGPMAMLFATTYPERVSALVLGSTFPKFVASPDYPWGIPPEQFAQYIALVENAWGETAAVKPLIPSMDETDPYLQWLATMFRRGATPGSAISMLKMVGEIDARHLLQAIRVPTLVFHLTADAAANVEGARRMAAEIPRAKYVELPGNHEPWLGDQDTVLGEIQEFLTGERSEPEIDRVLATVLFGDIVQSTERVAAMGDRNWAVLLSTFYDNVRREVERFRGHEIDRAGDGFLCSFDGPARAIRCACSIRDAVRALGLQLRAGLHTGECELSNGKMRGIALHIGARVGSMAGPGEVLVSSTVRDLVAGAGIQFADRGTHQLKGVPGDWRLFSVS